jgi:hypothetical protein
MSNDWIVWNGGECPVPVGTLVDIQYRDGELHYGMFAYENSSSPERDAGPAFWRNDGEDNDIIAYRVVNPKPAIERMDMDVLREAKEIQAARQERKEFFDKLDKQGLLFETYLFAVMGRFQCDADQAGKYIHEYLKGE